MPSPGSTRRRGAKVYPLFHVLRGLARAAGAPRIEARSSDPSRLRAVAWRNGDRTQLWFANLREEPLEVRLEGLPAGPARLRTLDEASFEAAAKDPAFGERSEPYAGRGLTLQPFAVAHLSLGD